MERPRSQVIVVLSSKRRKKLHPLKRIAGRCIAVRSSEKTAKMLQRRRKKLDFRPVQKLWV